MNSTLIPGILQEYLPRDGKKIRALISSLTGWRKDNSKDNEDKKFD